MNNIAFYSLIFTALISISGLILGIQNMRISFKNRRNALREKVFEEQLIFFLEINKMNALITEQAYNLASPNFDSSSTLNELEKLIDKFNILFEGCEILVPPTLYSYFDSFINHINQVLKDYYKDESSYTKEKRTETTRLIIDINDGMKDYLGLEKLSDENRKLARGEEIIERKVLTNKKVG